MYNPHITWYTLSQCHVRGGVGDDTWYRDSREKNNNKKCVWSNVDGVLIGDTVDAFLLKRIFTNRRFKNFRGMSISRLAPLAKIRSSCNIYHRENEILEKDISL